MTEQQTKTIELQKQFICPIFTLWYGTKPKAHCDLYATEYHAAQMARALRLNGTEFNAYNGKGQAISL